MDAIDDGAARIAAQVELVTAGPGAAPAPAARAAAASLRAITAWLVTAPPDDPALEPLAAALAELAGALPAAGPTRQGPLDAGGRAVQPNARGTDRFHGAGHPAAAPLALRAVDGHVLADVTYGPADEGAPGVVHGGVVAAAFDAVLAVASVGGAPGGGPTGTLTVRFVAPTPLGVPLRYDAHVGSVEGRKVHVRGELRRNDRAGDAARCAEAHAVVVVRT